MLGKVSWLWLIVGILLAMFGFPVISGLLNRNRSAATTATRQA